MEYPQGSYIGTQIKVKFSWIENVRLLDQLENEIMNIGNGLEIVDKQGNLIYDTIEDATTQRNVPKNREDFYVRFKLNNDNVKKIKVKIDYKYLESCYGELYQYSGEIQNWKS